MTRTNLPVFQLARAANRNDDEIHIAKFDKPRSVQRSHCGLDLAWEPQFWCRSIIQPYDRICVDCRSEIDLPAWDDDEFQLRTLHWMYTKDELAMIDHRYGIWEARLQVPPA